MLAVRHVRRLMLATALSAVVAGTTACTVLGSPPAPQIRAQLAFAAEADRLVPADGRSATTVTALVTDPAGQPLARRVIALRSSDSSGGIVVTPVEQPTGPDGRATFEVRGQHPGRATLSLFDAAPGSAGRAAAAHLDVEFTRKVVLLAPGFSSALAQRFAIFGTPRECADPARPGSIYEALVCLGYRPDETLDGTSAGATIVDMSWEATRCRPTDAPESLDCVATIERTADSRDVIWRPVDYDLASFAVSLLRHQQVDAWAHRLATTISVYDQELVATAGHHASFYLVGHSLGGEVVVRALRAVLDDGRLRGSFEGDQRGLLKAVVSVDGALNWTGGVAFFGGGPRCGFPVYTLADEDRERDNADAVERAADAFGTTTVALTSVLDPIVGPDVALLSRPVRPARGYVERLLHTDATDGLDCTHSTLLWPEPVAPVTYPLNDLLVEHVGPAAGAPRAASTRETFVSARTWQLRLRAY